MNTTSPNKRRALAPVDANTRRSPLQGPRLSPSKLDLPRSKMALCTSPIGENGIKRQIEQENDRETPGSTKKRRLSVAGTESLSPRKEMPLQKEANDTPRPRSTSPEDLSVFDNSTIENSQVTVISEPDVEPPTTPAVAENRPRQGSMTREEARQVSPSSARGRRGGFEPGLTFSHESDRCTTRKVTSPAIARQVAKTDPIHHRLVTTTTSYITTTCSGRVTKGGTEKTELTGENRKSIFKGAAPTPVAREKGIKQLCYQTLPPEVLNTPQRTLAGKDDELSDPERGGAAEGLLSLSQSSPASALR
ncbi:hypothetical protein GQX73_g4439 [Xylaria multiplex]|uniref:Uncharacterized protein n=1 Tax=Xylaria multiplex TaxID=323545 RepID=A0A7C8IPR8_9PEZI|nr:hypothetical protein GQX73_g4439 [Xylaria multiplex]